MDTLQTVDQYSVNSQYSVNVGKAMLTSEFATRASRHTQWNLGFSFVKQLVETYWYMLCSCASDASWFMNCTSSVVNSTVQVLFKHGWQTGCSTSVTTSGSIILCKSSERSHKLTVTVPVVGPMTWSISATSCDDDCWCCAVCPLTPL